LFGPCFGKNCWEFGNLTLIKGLPRGIQQKFLEGREEGDKKFAFQEKKES